MGEQHLDFFPPTTGLHVLRSCGVRTGHVAGVFIKVSRDLAGDRVRTALGFEFAGIAIQFAGAIESCAPAVTPLLGIRESEIDVEVLPDLTEGDLDQLGVPLGHRKRLLKAIAALGTGETATKPPSPAPASSPATAERRPITVLFCDLVGSTSLAAKLDAEDWRTLVNTYLDEA